MKLVTFVHEHQEKIGVVEKAGRVVDLHRAYGSYLREAESNPMGDQFAAVALGRDMIEFLKRGASSLGAAKKALAHISSKPDNDGDRMVFSRQQIHLKAPVPRPGA